MALGVVAGIISSLGFLKLSAFLKEKIKLHDTCGVHNLHGMPGVYGSLISAVFASFSDSYFSNDPILHATFAEVKKGRTASS